MKAFYTFLILACSALSAAADDLSATHTAASFGKKDGSISLLISGGMAPYRISWTGPGGFSDTVANLSDLEPGTYCATVTDNYCGSATLCVTVEEGPNAIRELPATAFSLRPNPFSAGIQVRPGQAMAEPLTLLLSDVSGRVLLRQELEGMAASGYYLATGTALAPGVYVLQVRTAAGLRWQQRVLCGSTH
jgi:hypothetical protein